ncbi:uncharacterized protein [Diabrotica undecimpunctata]|uniref:uncharacterized protein n=1 Tax=Diabrotica undecimpunctata TaxID=50387 RepID=UPI003B6408F8
MPGDHCAVNTCKNSRSKTGGTFFTFPKDPQRAETWARAAGREDLYVKLPAFHKSYQLCHLHFDDNCFLNYLRNRLKPTAVPTIFSCMQGSSDNHRDHSYSVLDINVSRNGCSMQGGEESVQDQVSGPAINILQNIVISNDNVDKSTSPLSEFSPTLSTQTPLLLSSHTPRKEVLRSKVKELRNENYRLSQKINELENQVLMQKSDVLNSLSAEDCQQLIYKLCP